jgi:hypothetical protein
MCPHGPCAGAHSSTFDELAASWSSWGDVVIRRATCARDYHGALELISDLALKLPLDLNLDIDHESDSALIIALDHVRIRARVLAHALGAVPALDRAGALDHAVDQVLIHVLDRIQSMPEPLTAVTTRITTARLALRLGVSSISPVTSPLLATSPAPELGICVLTLAGLWLSPAAAPSTLTWSLSAASRCLSSAR